MLVEDVDAVMDRCFLVHGLTPEERKVVVESGRLAKVSEGEYFFHQGEESSLMYIILRGRAKLTQITPEGDQMIVNYFVPGDGLGIIVALSHMPYPLSAEAAEDCLALAWDRETMTQLMERFPQMALNGMEMIGQRFARLQQRYQELATQRVEQRVARALLRLVRQFGKRVPEGVLIDMPLSREELAQMTGTNLYNVSRIMRRWETEGLVDSGRLRVVICKAHELVVIAEDLPR